MARLRPLTRSRARTVLLLVVAKVFPPNSVQMRQLAVGEFERVRAELGVRA
jgi:hypothetical protein